MTCQTEGLKSPSQTVFHDTIPVQLPLSLRKSKDNNIKLLSLKYQQSLKIKLLIISK